MIKLPSVEFYITNVCNLECRGCNRFNNYKFTGHYYWDDHASDIEAWSKRIAPDKITIMGGEPRLHPELETWVANLRRLWPDAHIMIQSNGTYMRPEFNTFYTKYNVGTAISLHDLETVNEIVEKNPPTDGYIAAFVFHQAAVIKRDSYFVVHHSAPDEAFRHCGMKSSYTMHSGKLYKCPTMAILPEFKKQFDLRMTDGQTALLESYTPMTSDCSDSDLYEFINDKDNTIPQCEFCPDSHIWQNAYGEKIITFPNSMMGSPK